MQGAADNRMHSYVLGVWLECSPWVLLICICHLYLRVVIRMLDLVLECSFSHDPAGGATISKERKPQNKKTLIV